VQKAREGNMPADNIERAIQRGAGGKDGVQLEEIRYEGYGPNGVAVMVDAVTDNRNRTVAAIRNVFTRSGGSLGEANSVAWMFNNQGVIRVAAAGRDPEELTLQLLVRRQRGGVPIEGVTLRAHFLLARRQSLASARQVLLHHVDSEVEELLQRLQVAVRFLAPLTKSNQDEILLQVPLFFRERVQRTCWSGSSGATARSTLARVATFCGAA